MAVPCKLQHLLNAGHQLGPGDTEMNEHSRAVKGASIQWKTETDTSQPRKVGTKPPQVQGAQEGSEDRR